MKTYVPQRSDMTILEVAEEMAALANETHEPVHTIFTTFFSHDEIELTYNPGTDYILVVQAFQAEFDRRRRHNANRTLHEDWRKL